MNWKAYAKWAGATLFSALIIGCSSKPTSQKSSIAGIYAENAKLGAIYQNRQVMPSYMNFARVQAVGNKQPIVNGRDFISQLNYVRSYSSRITGNYAGVYSKVQRWVDAGANVNDLAK